MRAFVTGAGGFLGFAISRKLHERGDSVITAQRGAYEKLDRLEIQSHRLDLSRIDALPQLTSAMEGCDAVFHVAAKAGVWGSKKTYWQANVVATQYLLTAMRAAGVKVLVYTSSPSVCFTGKDEEGEKGMRPYPRKYLAHYPASKAEAEKIVLSANGTEWATTALRPHLIWGPDDPHLVPRVLERGAKGRLRLVGSGENLVDSTYIDNAAEAHLNAADTLLKARDQGDAHQASCAGKAYYISNGEPIAMKSLLNRILAAGGQPEVHRSISANKAYAAGKILETLYKLTGQRNEPIMTRFVARQLSTHHWYDLSEAENDFGYRPVISLDQGFERLSEWLTNQHAK